MKKTIIISFVVLGFLIGISMTSSAQNVVNLANEDVSGLIAAINNANANQDLDVINLSQGGTYTLTTINNANGWSGPNGLPIITSRIIINGNGATIKRSIAPGTPDFRVIYIGGATADLTLNAVTITGGRSAQGTPGAIMGGGGLRNEGLMQIKNCTITGNDCFGVYYETGGNIGGDGGGILNLGNLYIINSTISYNTGNGGYGGGGIMSLGGKVTIINSTIFENRNNVGRGDAIALDWANSIIKNSIFASPTQGVGGIIYNYYSNTISLGHNIVGDANTITVFTGPGDLNNTNPLLGPLADNGGATYTHSPLPGSPAIDAIPLAYCTDTNGIPITTDQRGIIRPQGLACDIGSVELIICSQINVNLSPNPIIYNGYGERYDTLKVINVTGGTPPYTYLWSPGGFTTQSIVVNPVITTNYTVTVTDINNCQGNGNVTVTVKDIRCGNKNDKVLVCHNGMDLCISPNAVPAHLAHGDKLGHCGDNPVNVSGNLPTEFKLNPNYPNPFNPVTKISFDIPKQSFVALIVYDQLGRKVRTLVNEVKSAGSYIIDFNGSDLSSGIYFYRIETESFKDTKRMILIK